jgi:hypothetical protein
MKEKKRNIRKVKEGEGRNGRRTKEKRKDG